MLSVICWRRMTEAGNEACRSMTGCCLSGMNTAVPARAETTLVPASPSATAGLPSGKMESLKARWLRAAITKSCSAKSK